LRQFPKVLESIDQALALKPELAVAHYIRGTVLSDMNQFDQALMSHARALSIQPGDVETLIGQGMALRGLNRHEEALRTFDQALKVDASHVNSHLARGLALENLKRYEEALGSVDRALVLQPDNADAHHNRGALMVKLRRPDDALASYSNALAANPNHLASLSDRGDTLMYTRRSEAAVKDFARLAALDPDYPYVHGNLLHAKLSCCDWQGLDALARTIAADTQLGKKAAEPFSCIGFIKSPALLKHSAEIYVADQFPNWAENRFPSAMASGDKIRLGYVAGEFRHHATSILMAELFERHDNDRFTIYAFDNGWDDGSPMRRRLLKSFAEIVDISRLSDVDAAQKVREKGIDILIDLNGHVGRKRTGLFALRAAPVQVNWLGFPGTIGAGFMDYIIGDAVITPESHAEFYSEAIVRLPGSYQANDSKRVIAEYTPTRAESGLPESGFVFCCFNDNYKITPEVFEVWTRLLKQVKHSVLWLLESNAAATRNLRAEAASRGIDEKRLVFAKRIDQPDHLARHRLADLFLDTLPCNAHTTASDALWAGLPLLTCLGDTDASLPACCTP
jgi:predicted O-linked N-acetylglucosamine transferase (SPINDLY family)